MPSPDLPSERDAAERGLFKEGLVQCLAKVKLHALHEVDRLHEAVVELRSENQQLRNQLAQQKSAAAMTYCGVEACQKNHAEPLERRSVVRECSTFASIQALRQSNHSDDVTSRKIEAERKSVVLTQKIGRVKSISDKVYSVLVTDSPEPMSRTTSRQLIYKGSGLMQKVAKSPVFDHATMVLVLMNALWIGFDLDLNAKTLLESPLPFQIVENFFVAIFLMELIIRFLAFKDKCLLFYDKWFLFDFSLVAVMIIESWVLTLIIAATQSKDYPGVGVISALRIMRLLRVVRVARLCRAFPELQTMISGMLAGIRSVLITAIILLAITYSFAILLRQLGNSSSWGERYFSTVPQSVYTLLVSSMLPDNHWLLDLIGGETWYCGIIYFVFLLLTAITVMNMLVGVLCDDIFRVSHAEMEQRHLDSMSEKLQEILRTIDGDFDGNVSRFEFESMLENPDAVRLLSKVGVDVVALVGQIDTIFNDGSEEVQLPFSRFRKEVLQFRSSNLATVGSVMAMRRFTQDSVDVLSAKLDALELLISHGSTPPAMHSSSQERRSNAYTSAWNERKESFALWGRRDEQDDFSL